MDNRNEDRCRWIDHQGIQILFTDFRGLAPDDYFSIIDRAIRMISSAAPRSVYTLSAHSKIHINEKLTAKTNEYKKAAEGISKGTAAFGLEGIKRVIAKSVKKDVYFASSMDDALEWIRRQNKNAWPGRHVGSAA